MAVTNPFFTKREPQNFSTRTGSTVSGLNNPSSSAVPSHSASASQLDTSSTRTAESMAAATPPASPAPQSGSKLTVGPKIKLKGLEITDCDTLVVEGTVEATMDSRVIEIAQQGAFHGSAEIDIAEIHGEFTGTLTVRQKLVIHSTGKVSGKIRYGHIVIEEGGQLSGEIEVGVPGRSEAAKASSPKAAAVAA